jgi:hypothetical protein
LTNEKDACKSKEFKNQMSEHRPFRLSEAGMTHPRLLATSMAENPCGKPNGNAEIVCANARRNHAIIVCFVRVEVL